MNYAMTNPCDQCPFLRDSGFTFGSLLAHARGPFPCHKTCELKGDTFVERNDNTPHCAGALIFNELRRRPHQVMRIVERLGFYDRTKLNMKANVGSSSKDYRREKGNTHE